MNVLLPAPNADTEIFYNGCKNKRLLFQKCKKCGKVRWPYSHGCPECFSFDKEIVEVKGYGKIYSFTIYNVAFHKLFKGRVPYVVAVVELEHNVKFMSNIVESSFDKIKCDAPVKVVWEQAGEYFLPKFKLYE